MLEITEFFDIFGGFGIIFAIASGMILIGFIFTISFMFNPKLRAKMMSKQVKATKYMMQDNEKDLKYMATKGAEISKDGIEITTRAIKDGFNSEEEKIYCKHCGEYIDADSKFCSECGKEQ